MPALRLPSGEPLARGNTSDIWPWTERTVVKVLRPGIPAQWASIEADIVERVHAAGLPVPGCDGVLELEGRAALVLERIEGESMWERIKARPTEVASLVRRLIDLQLEVQATVVDGLPALTERLAHKVDEAMALPDDERWAARTMVAELPVEHALCHGDFHPANLVLSAGGTVILDWFDAAVGHPVADFVRSSLLLRPPDTPSAWLSGATPHLLDVLHCDYLTGLVGRGLIEPATFAAWEAVMAVGRLSEPVPTGDLLAIWGRWRSDGPAAASAMLRRCRGQVVGLEATG
jgi:aminoglycoside phosphotransferase (APT) family kinase protein